MMKYFKTFTFLVLLLLSFVATKAQAGQPADKCATQCAIGNATGTEAIQKRQECDQCRLEQDQENLRTVRETEDGEEVQQNFDSCVSDYQNQDPGTTPISAGQYVPVHETGDLLAVAQTTRDNTILIRDFSERNYDMNILLCMYLHAIKRVQYAFEDLEFIRNPDMRRQAATKVEEYKEALLGDEGLIQTGYTPSGEQSGSGNDRGGASLYPKNLNSYLNDAGREAVEVYLSELSNSGNAFKEEVTAALTSQIESLSPSTFSTVSREQYAAMQRGGLDLPNDEWWTVFLNLNNIDSPNNPASAYQLSVQEMAREINDRQTNALNEYMAGNGYLPIRKCIRYMPDNRSCDKWENTTPASTVGSIVGDAMRTKVDMYINPALGQIGEGNEPTTIEAESFRPSYTGGGGDTGGINDPDNPIEPNDPNNPDPNDPDNPDPDNPNNNRPPIADIYYTVERSLGTMTIHWSSANARICKTDNAWLGNDNQSTKLVRTMKPRAQSIALSGQQSYFIPLSFNATWSRDNGSFISDNMSTTTNAASTSIKVKWNVPTPTAENDTITLKIVDGDNRNGYMINVGGSSNPFSHRTATAIVNAFRNYESSNNTASRRLPVYDKYLFGYYTINGAPYITIQLRNPVYSIWCRAANGRTSTANSND